MLPTARICPYFYGNTAICPQHGNDPDSPGKSKKIGSTKNGRFGSIQSRIWSLDLRTCNSPECAATLSDLGRVDRRRNP